MTTDFDADAVIEEVARQLAVKFPQRDPVGIRAIVAEEVALLRGRPVTDYIAVLSARAAADRLRAPLDR